MARISSNTEISAAVKHDEAATDPLWSHGPNDLRTDVVHASATVPKNHGEFGGLRVYEGEMDHTHEPKVHRISDPLVTTLTDRCLVSGPSGRSCPL